MNEGLSKEFKRPETEFQDETPYHTYLKSLNLRDEICQKTILDFGSGYGGRTVWYARDAQWVEGIEIRSRLVDISNEYAKLKQVANVRFTLGEETKIAFSDEYFDVIITFDVLEHVKQPDLILKELHRVLKRNGLAIIIFTPYYGIFEHHLNYITLFPALHLLFPPQKLIDAINDLLCNEPQFQALQMPKQPPPELSYHGKRKCLPTLNGLTVHEYKGLIRSLGFEIKEFRTTPILERFPILGSVGKVLNRIINWIPGCNELFSHNVVSILYKR
jgi:ubiquinone/menaquinone biosynthesis C-methylase UbiE